LLTKERNKAQNRLLEQLLNHAHRPVQYITQCFSFLPINLAVIKHWVKLKNDDLFRLVLVWQTAQISTLSAVNASIPDGTELVLWQELQLDEKASPMGAPKLHVRMFYCWFSHWILLKKMAEHKLLS